MMIQIGRWFPKKVIYIHLMEKPPVAGSIQHPREASFADPVRKASDKLQDI